MSIYVNILVTKKFTQDHLEKYKSFRIPEKYSKIFGKEKPKSFKVIGFPVLVDFDDVDWLYHDRFVNSQTARKIANKQEKELEAEIARIGWDLTHLTIMLRRLPNGKLIPINGRTRKAILLKYGVKNFIAEIFECSDSDFSLMQTTSNNKKDVFGPVSMEDIKLEVNRALLNGWISRDLKTIEARVRYQAEGIYKDQKIDQVSQELYNNYAQDGDERVLNWNTSLKFKQDWLIEKGYLDTDDYIYFPTSSQTISKSIVDLAKISKKNKNKEIRVVVHTGVLESSDLELCFQERVKKFTKEWVEKLEDISFAYFKNNTLESRINIYAFFPTLTSLHDPNKIVPIKTAKKQLKEYEEKSVQNKQKLAKKLEEEYNEEVTDDNIESLSDLIE